MGTSLLAMKRRKRHLTGPVCLMVPIQWQCRRVFCPRAKPPPLVRAPIPATAAVLPTAARSDALHLLPLTESLMLLPPAQPDLLSLPLFISTLLPHTRRKRILALALHVQSQGPKQADHLWMPSFLPSSSSSSGIMLEEPPPQVEKMLLWACSMYTHKVSTSPPSNSWTTKTTTPKPLRPQLIMAL